MKDDISTPTTRGDSPNRFEREKPGTAERSRAEAAIEDLRQSGGVFVNAVRATRMPMILTNPNLPGNPIVFANDAFLKLSGYAMDEVLGQQPHFMNGRATDRRDAARFAEALRSDQDDIIETVQYRKDGSRFVATVLLSAFKDEQGHTLNHFMSWLDVTRRVDAEEQLGEERTQRKALRDELRNTQILQDLGARLVSEDNIKTVYEEILSTAILIVGAKAGTIQMLDRETEELVVIASQGFSQRTSDHFHRMPASETTSCGLALQTGDRAYISFDPESREKASRLHVADGILSAQSSPLISRSGKPIGMVSTHWGEAFHRLTTQETTFLDLLTRQAADLLEQRFAEAALRRSERHAQTLLAELQHRVRNSLAVVRSIARRTADRSDNLDEMIAHFEGRLNAFSRVQAAVTRGAGTGIDLSSIIEDELLAVAAREGEQLRINGPEVQLKSRAAESISLAIHELATNAVKYGALSVEGGRIRVDWDRVRNGGSVSELRLVWTEGGLPSRPEPQRDGFGHEMLLRSLPYDLGAETDITFTDDGMRFTLSVPLTADIAALDV